MLDILTCPSHVVFRPMGESSRRSRRCRGSGLLLGLCVPRVDPRTKDDSFTMLTV